MSTTPAYWMWENVITKESCDSIIQAYYRDDSSQQALVGFNGGVIDIDYRKSNVCWIPETEAISYLLLSKSLIANFKAGWGFDIEGNQNTQIAKYEGGGHYDWHTDESFYVKENLYHRKISSVLFLSDPSTYEGGELLLKDKEDIKIKNNAGTLVCFPSEIRHKVTPVTGGVRYSLASWAIGPLVK